MSGIGYEVVGSTCRIDSDSLLLCFWLICRVKLLLDVQKEERRRYHALNEIRMKKLFLDTLRIEFYNKGEIEITLFLIVSI